jgi:ureidoglycolate hydrolase
MHLMRTLSCLLVAAGIAAAETAKPPRPAALSNAVLEPGDPVVSIATEPLAEPAFRAFGQVVTVPADTPPTLETGVMRFWGGLAKTRIHEEIEFGLLSVRNREHEVAEMERHMKTPEFIVSLAGDFLLAVAPISTAGSTHPVASTVRVFLVRQGEGVLLRQGVWHAQPFPVKDEAQLLIAWRDGTLKRDVKTSAMKRQEVVKF